MFVDAVDNRCLGLGDGKMSQILKSGDPFTAALSFGNGVTYAQRQTVQASGNLIVLQLFPGPHQPFQFTAQDDGIAVHGLFQQGPKLIKLFLVADHKWSCSFAFTGLVAPFSTMTKKDYNPFYRRLSDNRSSPVVL